jgi:hypothetical protein
MRSIRLAVRSDGEIVVSAAKSVPVFIIERFVAQKQAWIEAQREKMRTRVRVAPVPSASEYKQYKQAALELVKERVAHFSAIYGFVPKRVSVGNGTLWRWQRRQVLVTTIITRLRRYHVNVTVGPTMNLSIVSDRLTIARPYDTLDGKRDTS